MAYNSPEIMMTLSYNANTHSLWCILERFVLVLLLRLGLSFCLSIAVVPREQSLPIVVIGDAKSGMNNAMNGHRHKTNSGKVTDVKIKKDARVFYKIQYSNESDNDRSKERVSHVSTHL